ncbi:hypothetical protein FH608_050775 [Nonomuraea phyllanthi]|uniref:Uncharacterized protein n=1 Tax=Nonomuraea phyllanthi TaxID=2219224 RepID=A0A5C4UUH2_9ACTN|nr:hypothetical protein [Nonomuraea phyllanthi]KAB8181806.1 hypothetical protein FH608_050775 [Nonomuraea phyllanthi]QFY08006.1 hypothetical protein GBF35_16165 [Nonomuraea phyllanthi]
MNSQVGMMLASRPFGKTDNVSQAKADWDPVPTAECVSPLVSFHCEYAKSWIYVKHDWGLSMQVSEKHALIDMLASC